MPSRQMLYRCARARAALVRRVPPSAHATDSFSRRASTLSSAPSPSSSSSPSKSTAPPSPPPLSVLPLSSVLRSLMTSTVTSSPLMLRPCMAVMTVLANSHNALLDPDRNPVLRLAMKRTFYAQFCAGETPAEVQRTIADLKATGFHGVILGYAREVVMKEDEAKGLAADSDSDSAGLVDADSDSDNDIASWADGTLQTVDLASAGDFVAIKFTGAGRAALRALVERRPLPPPALAAATDRICDRAVARGVRLLIDAEQQALQSGIDDWTMAYMRRYNTPQQAVVYGTYQAYLKAAAATLSRHLAEAQRGGFALGVKLVRGAYLGSDPRHLIHDTKEDTDRAYDGLADAVLRQEWKAPLTAPTTTTTMTPFPFPAVGLVVASHNAESVRRAQATIEAGEAQTTDVAFAQLQGMADEVSCALVAGKGRAKESKSELESETEAEAEAKAKAPPPPPPVQAYKYLVWGSAGECVKYLLRRAQENKDAVQRTRSTREAMLGEVVRRARAVLGRG